MKKACFAFVMIYILSLAACNYNTVELPPLPTLAAEENITKALVAEPTVTAIPRPTTEPAVTTETEPELTATPMPTATPIPVLTATPKPTATPIPELTATPRPTTTPIPELIATPRPTATPTPEPMATPAPTATPCPLSPEMNKLLDRGKVYPNTRIRGEVCTSKAEVNEFVREKSLIYSSFAVIAEDMADLQSAEEYMTLYPEILNMTIEKIDRYDNGFCAVVTNVEAVDDANLCYTIRTGEFSVLSEIEKEIFDYLNEVLEQTGVRELSTVEAIKALHDYLVLELKYDQSYREASHSPEGVMRNKKAVCDGYARTMRLLLLMTGIESRIISGTVDDQPHAWNLVKVDGDWYHVDVTWDDPIPDEEGKVRYLYFLKNDTDMAKTHIWESEIACTENDYQIYMYQEGLCDSYETLREVYERQIGAKEYLLFCYPKGGSLTQERILEFVMNALQTGVAYYPEKELEDYLILEIVNPLLSNRE